MRRSIKIIELILFLGILVIFVIAISHILWRWFNNTGNSFSGAPIELLLLIEAGIWLVIETVLVIARWILKRKIIKSADIPYSTKIMGPIRKKPLRTIIISIIILVILMISLLPSIETRLLYHNTECSAECEYYLSHHADFEQIEIEGEEYNYHGWMHKGSGKKTVVYFGGNAQNSADTMELYDSDAFWGIFGEYNFLMIDYPGYGKSEGEPAKDTLMKMSEEVMSYVRDNSSLNEEISVMGFSLGTGIATYAASQYKIDKLVLLAPYDEMLNVYNSIVNIFHFPLKLLLNNNYQSEKYASSVKNKVLVIASKDDEIIPYELSQNLVNSFKGNVVFKTIKDAGHNDIPLDSNVRKEIKEFLN